MVEKKALLKKHGLNKPFRSWRKNKKFVVFVKDPKSGKIKTVHYGDSRYEDFTQHKDKKRRANFRARHGCSQKTDKTTAGYWACNDLW